MEDIYKDLSERNSDPSWWKWRSEGKEKWSRAPQHWQDFRQEWYGEKEKTIPRVLEMNAHIVPSRTSTSILIRDSYVKMFDIVYPRAMEFHGGDAAIITGDRGIGKTLFLYYFLIRLLKLKQVILFSPRGEELYLFYHDGVYMPRAKPYLSDTLPVPKNTLDLFIWSLFDIAVEAEPPSIMVDWPCFPVQTASPNPSRFKIWSKDRHTLRTGLPLWSKEELAEGLELQVKYRNLTTALEKLSVCAPGSTDPLFMFPGARSLLERGFPEADAPPTPEEAIAFLLNEAIDRFGYAARDVFRAVLSDMSLAA